MKLRNELLQLLILLAASIFIFKVLFFKTDIIIILKTLISFFFTFIIPGYALMYYWNDKFDFLERLIIGTVLGMALFGIVSYHTGLLGFHIKYQSIFLPVLFSLAGVVLFLIKNKNPEDF